MAVHIVAMTCPECKGKFHIGPAVGYFACASCGSEYRIQREGGIIALVPVQMAEREQSPRPGPEKRLQEEIRELEWRVAMIRRNRSGYEQEYQQRARAPRDRRSDLLVASWLALNIIISIGALLALGVGLELLPPGGQEHIPQLRVIGAELALMVVSWLAWMAARRAHRASVERAVSAMMEEDLRPLHRALAERQQTLAERQRTLDERQGLSKEKQRQTVQALSSP